MPTYKKWMWIWIRGNFSIQMPMAMALRPVAVWRKIPLYWRTCEWIKYIEKQPNAYKITPFFGNRLHIIKTFGYLQPNKTVRTRSAIIFVAFWREIRKERSSFTRMQFHRFIGYSKKINKSLRMYCVGCFSALVLNKNQIGKRNVSNEAKEVSQMPNPS